MTLCGVELKRGEKRQIKLPFSDGAAWNAWLLCGTKPGKTLLVTAGVHGCEFVGILALQKLVETLECTDFCGQIVALPLVNPEGFFAGVKQVNPTDGKNLNREFPGKEDGTETQKMAWMMENVLYSEADFLLDLHGGDWNEELTPLVFFPCGADKTIGNRPVQRQRLFLFLCASVPLPGMVYTAGQHRKEFHLCCWSEVEMADGRRKK